MKTIFDVLASLFIAAIMLLFVVAWFSTPVLVVWAAGHFVLGIW